MNDLENKVMDLIAEVLVDVDRKNILLDSRIVEDLGAESLDIYDMTVLFEDEFGLEISDEDIELVSTVGDVVSLLRVAKGLGVRTDDFMFAVKSGNLSVVEQLVRCGTNVNGTDIPGHRNALMAAVVHKRVEVAAFLLSAGANINACDRSGRTPLMAACNLWNEDLARLLLNNGADVKAKDSAGLTALMYCFLVSFRRQFSDVPNGFHSFPPTPGFVTPDSRNVDYLVHYNSLSGSTSEGLIGPLPLIDMLLQYGADPNTTGPQGCNALILAARGILCKVGVKGLQDPGGLEGPMDRPCEREALLGLDTVVGCLLDRGADVNLSDHYGRTALMHACAGGHQQAVKILLERGADINGCDRDGMAALHWAARGVSFAIGGLIAFKANISGTVEFEFPRVITLLLENGADGTLRNSDGQTAFEIAEARGRTKTAATLQYWLHDQRALPQ